MFSNLALSGGAHLCIPFIGFLRATISILQEVRCVSCCSGGALVAVAWLLEIPDTVTMRILTKHMSKGILRDMDVAMLLDRMGLVDVEATVGAMCREILDAGLCHWRTIKKGWEPDPEATGGSALTMQDIVKMTGKVLAVGVCDAGKDFAETYITADTHPELEVWRALSASCAVPFAFTPVRIGDSLFCDSCVRDGCPSFGIPWPVAREGMVDTLEIEVRVTSGLFKSGNSSHTKNARPKDLMQYGRGILAALAERVPHAAVPSRTRQVTIPRWTEERLAPLVMGARPDQVLGAYDHGVRCGKDFLEIVNKEASAA